MVAFVHQVAPQTSDAPLLTLHAYSANQEGQKGRGRRRHGTQPLTDPLVMEPVRPEPYRNSRAPEALRVFLHDLYTGWGNRWAAPEADPPREQISGK
jgi:hypothetical protein